MTFASKTFRVHLLLSQMFVVVTGHMYLRYSFQRKDIHGRLVNWLEFLSEYDLEISYRPGKENSAADFLSRPFPDGVAGTEENVGTIFY